MTKSIILPFLYSIILPFINIEDDKSLEILGTYVLKETINDNVKIEHNIQFQNPDLCNWYSITKINGKKEKCKRLGYFKISEEKVIIEWSRNECENCGTYANWYENECSVEILVYKNNTLWTTDTIPKQFVRVK